MDKLNGNFNKFIYVWVIVLLINQIFIFGACFYPTCILAALPHTGIIAFLITLKLIKNDTSKKTDDSIEYVTCEPRNKEKKELKKVENHITVEDLNKALQNYLDEKSIIQNNIDAENHKLLNKLNSEYRQLNYELNKLKTEKEEIIDKIEQFEYKQFNTFGNKKLKLLSLKKDNSQEAKDEYISFLSFYNKYQMYKPKERNNVKNINVNHFDNLSEVELKSKNIKRDIEHYKKNIEKLKESKTYQCLLKIVNQNRYFEIEKEKIENELDALVPKIEKKGLRIVKKAKKLTNKELILSVDNELENMQKELKSLELTLQNLVMQKTEYLNDIEEFNKEYNLHLGEIIKEILNLKKEILYKQAINQQKQKEKYKEDIQTFEETKATIEELKSTISELNEALETIDKDDENYDELAQAYKELQEELNKLEDEIITQEEELNKTKEFIEDEDIEKEYEDVKSHYNEFENEYENIKDIQKNTIKLNDDEKIEIKKLYKKAARLCHPDIVPIELKEKAHELMQLLNEAYSKKDIVKVKDILYSLENGTNFELSSETIEDKELLKQKINEYKQNIKDIESELIEIKEDETYQTIAELDSWDEYFEKLKNELINEKEKLKEEHIELLKGEEKVISEIDIDENKIPDWIQRVWNWAEKKEKDSEIIPRDKQKLQNLKAIEIDILIYDDNLLYPQELLYFKNLEKLVIGYLMAEHPNSIESYYNKFFAEIINTQVKIKELGLIELQISFVPNNISNLKLEKLCLWSNKIELLPDSIGDITSLKTLELADNKLLKLPDTIVNLNNLENLELNQNHNLTLTDKQIEWIIKLEENGCKVELDDCLSELFTEYKIKNIKKTQSSSQTINSNDRSHTSSTSSTNYMGDGMWINDSDRWW